MSTESCILTTKDLAIIEAMRDRRPGREDSLAPILKRKIEAARVVFHDDVPANVATLRSRVTFRVDGRTPETRILSPDHTTFPLGMFLPISTARGLALLGLAEGQDFRLTGDEGREETIMLEKVHYQPEADGRETELTTMLPASVRSRPALRLIRGALDGRTSPVPAGYDDNDDPGPSAA